MIQLLVVLWLTTVAVVGVGTWKVSSAFAGREFQEYRLREQKLALEKEKEYARLLETAQAETALTAAQFGAAQRAADAAGATSRFALARLAVAERDLRISAAAVRVFNASAGSERATAPAEAASRADATAGRTEADSTLGRLLEVATENNVNHQKCVGQVLGLQEYSKTLYTYCGGTNE
jgi:hypothetical protein